jgi:tetratricopeptide (TPR) repeat protein
MNPHVSFLLSKATESIQSSALSTAELFLHQVFKLQPANPEALRLSGVIAALNGNYSDALENLDKAILNSPKFALAYSNKGNVCLELGRYEESLVCYNKAISIQPNNYETHNNKGNLLQELKKYNEAIDCYDTSISLRSDYYEAYTNKANALTELKRFDDAILYYEKSLAINSNNPNAWLGMGWAFHAKKVIDKAEFFLKRALSIDLHHAQANENLAHVYLKNLAFIDGWKHNEYRWQLKGSESRALLTTKPRWTGLELRPQLFIWSEQGIGDQILYSSMLHELNKFSQKNLISLDKKLIPIFKRSFPNYEFINKDDEVSEDRYTHQIPIGSLGRIFRNSLEDFQRTNYPYIVDDAARTQRIKSKIEFSSKKTCGISWGSTNRKVGDHKSIPIHDLYPILGMKGIKFVNLQYGDVSSSLAQVKQDLGNEILCINEINLFDDVDGALSIISSCDIIVTCSNTTAHLAGALGKETLLLVPYSAGQFWYWHSIDGKSIWYPSVKVFEQQLQGDWTAPVHEVKEYLERRFA